MPRKSPSDPFSVKCIALNQVNGGDWAGSRSRFVWYHDQVCSRLSPLLVPTPWYGNSSSKRLFNLPNNVCPIDNNTPILSRVCLPADTDSSADRPVGCRVSDIVMRIIV